MPFPFIIPSGNFRGDIYSLNEPEASSVVHGLIGLKQGKICKSLEAIVGSQNILEVLIWLVWHFLSGVSFP